ncbi:MAG: hypothetical protein ABR962_09840 [Candidatus Bathyarchaeia archaeon]
MAFGAELPSFLFGSFLMNLIPLPARDVNGKGEVSLPEDITNKQAESTLNSSSARFSTWFVTITDYI